MEDKLRLNTKLFGFEGIIGRRDFFLNSVYITCIMILVTLPATYWIFTNIETLTDSFTNIFNNAPVFLKLYVLVGSIGVCILSLSNIFRRLNDICGKENRILQIFFSILALINAFYFFMPAVISYPIAFITAILGLIILFKKGKITSKYPYDFRKEFNWGAFLGTWVWGLFNKTYVTLWQLIIGLTPWGSLYALICGLKGNEWAFKNKKCDNIEQFNKSQEKQATVFAVLTFLIIPIIYFLIIFCIVGAIIFTTIDTAKNNPEKAKANIEKVENKLNTFMDTLADTYFEEYEITENENKFYILESDWKFYFFSDKKDMLDFAATTSAMIRKEEYDKIKKTDDKYVSFTKVSELPRTKIYGYKTRKLLGEYSIDIKTMENASFKDYIKAAANSYKFYKAE